MSTPLRLSLLLVAACIVAACAQAPAAVPTPTVLAPLPTPAPTSPAITPSPTVLSSTAAAKSPTPTTPAVSAPTATADDASSEADELVEEARAAVAKQLGVPAARVTVVSVQKVEWSDPSLGCPEPGMSYAQMITPGYLIRLESGGKTFEYHTDREGTVITCPNPQPPALVAN